MDWVCLHDQARLTSDDGTLSCDRCGRTYRREDGMPIFAADEAAAARSERPAPELDELCDLMETQGDEAAAERFAERLGCTRAAVTPDWKCFAPIPDGGTVLEIGPGFGDDTLAMSERVGRLVSIVPTLRNGRIIDRRLREASRSNVEVAVLPDLSRLPLPDGSVDTVVVEDLNAAGFGLSHRAWAAAAAEWKRVLVPDGAIFVGLGNPWDRRLGLHRLRRSLLAQHRPEALNRAIRRVAGGGSGGITFGRVVREMRRQGFAAPVAYAPLPDPNRIEVVIPVLDRPVVRYFLDHMLRRNSVAMRAAIALAGGAVRVGLFPHLVPFHFLVFRAERS